MNRHCTALLGLALTCGVLPPAVSSAVHKWVDGNGVTHYSDEPPDSVETTLIELPRPAVASTAREDDRLADDYYSIANQWRRMNQERLERERLNLERARIRATRQTPAPPPAAAADDDIRYVPIYTRFHFPRHHRRHHRFDGGPRSGPRPPAPTSLGTFPTQ